METKEISTKDLNKLHHRATKDAISENKALGLTYRKVKHGELVEMDKDGVERVIGKPRFGTIKVDKKTIKLKK